MIILKDRLTLNQVVQADIEDNKKWEERWSETDKQTDKKVEKSQ